MTKTWSYWIIACLSKFFARCHSDVVVNVVGFWSEPGTLFLKESHGSLKITTVFNLGEIATN